MDNQAFETAIRKEIETRKMSFSADESVFRSYIRQNADTVRDYNGRQVFEMLQNMDDQMEQASPEERKSSIVFNKQSRTLSFLNQGEPFSIDGIKSIMMPNISPKVGRRTIGNKGLGFRSLLNWEPKEIIIRSNGMELLFSQDAIIESISSCEKLVENIRRLPAGEAVPILAFPRMTPHIIGEGWSTEIELRGLPDKALESIEQELHSFRPEIMLFLPNLREMDIRFTDAESVSYVAGEWQALPEGGNHVFLRSIIKMREGQSEDRMDWVAYRASGVLEGISLKEGESASYNVAIAVLRDASRRKDIGHILHNYLPVRSVEIPLPCLVHATVALNSARDGLLPGNEANRRIFSDILPTAFKDFAAFLRANAESEVPLLSDKWFPWRLLMPKKRWGGVSVNGLYLGPLYAQMADYAKNELFIPCVDGHYHTMKDSRACPNSPYGKQGTVFFNQHPEILPNYVLSTENSPIPEDYPAVMFPPGELKSRVASVLVSHSFDDRQLAELIHVLWILGKLDMGDSGPYPVLRNEQGQFFPSEDTVYVPLGESGIALPPYLTLKFLGANLWHSICAIFEEDMRREKMTPREFVAKQLGAVFHVAYPDNKTVILQQIIDECKQRVEQEAVISKKRELVVQQLSALLQNYHMSGESIFRNLKGNIPLMVDNTGRIRVAGDFLFAKVKWVYDGQLSEETFLDEQIKQELLGDGGMGLRGEDGFLRCLGVRDDVRVIQAPLDDSKDKAYLRFLLECGEEKGGLPPGSKTSSPLGKNQIVVRLRDVDVIKNLSLSRLLQLFCQMPRNGLADLLSHHPSITWTKTRNWYSQEFPVDWSYCAFQLKDSRQDLVLEECAEELEKEVRSLVAAGRLAGEIESLLVKMGARRKLSDLSLEVLYSRLSGFDGKEGVQRYYKRIRDAIKSHLDRAGEEKRSQVAQECLRLADRFLPTLFARKGKGPIERVPRNEIRYWDNDTLPRILLDQFFKLEIGSRVGAQTVRQIFGIALLDETEMRVQIVEQVVSQSMTHELEEHLRLRLRYILAIRCRELPKGHDWASAASALHDLFGHFKIVSSCSYIFAGKHYCMEDGDLLPTEEGFIVCSNQQELRDAISQPNFCQALAEMLCIQFKLTGAQLAKDLRNAVKYTLEDIEYFRRNDVNEEDWRRAGEALGLDKDEKELWRAKIGRDLSPEEERKLAFRESRASEIRNLVGEDIPTTVALDIPLVAMTVAQTDAFVRWLAVPEFALGETVRAKIGEHLIDCFRELRDSHAGLFADTVHKRLMNAPIDEQKHYMEILRRYHRATDWYTNPLEELVRTHPMATQYEAWNLLRQTVAKTFGVTFPDDIPDYRLNAPERGANYLQILEKAKVTEDMLPLSARSLAFFPGNEKVFETTLNQVCQLDDDDGCVSSAREDDCMSATTAPTATISQVSDIQQFHGALSPKNPTGDRSSHVSHASPHYQSDKHKRKLGMIAQNLVKEAMRKEPERYRNVQDWTSLTGATGFEDDSRHYDFSYETPTGERRYVEVKAFDAGQFFFSKGEYAFARNEKYCQQYELALVHIADQKIQLLHAPFAPESPWQSKLVIDVDSYRGVVIA